MAKLHEYTISASVLVRASCTIKAASLQDAAAQAVALNVGDFVEPVEGQCFDDYEDFEVVSVWK